MHLHFVRIFYSTTFTLLTLLLTALLLVTPGDHIYQAFSKIEPQLYNIFIVGGAYLLTLLIAAFIYAGRLYTNRSVLAAVPRELGLFEEENGKRGKGSGSGSGVPRRVRRLVKEGLERSAWIAWIGRPRDLTKSPGAKPKDGVVGVVGGTLIAESKRSQPSTSTTEKQPPSGTPDPEETPVWGTISHPGWSSPDSVDLPNLHLPSILLELPHLIEAKAVSLAPASLLSTHLHSDSTLLQSQPQQESEEQAAIPSPIATSLLRRPTPMGLREYLIHLSSPPLSLIRPPSNAATFLEMYERARFSGRETTEHDFRALMGVFAEILRGMTALSPEMLQEIRAAEEEEAELFDTDAQDGDEEWPNYGADGAQDPDADIEEHPRASLDTTSTVAHTPLPPRSTHSSSSHVSSTASQLRHTPHSAPQAQAHGSPSTTRSRRGLRTPSIPSIRAPRSLRSRASSVFTSRSSARSIIHLAPEGEGEGGMLNLPYVINTSASGVAG